jgi:hypothetical protein
MPDPAQNFVGPVQMDGNQLSAAEQFRLEANRILAGTAGSNVDTPQAGVQPAAQGTPKDQDGLTPREIWDVLSRQQWQKIQSEQAYLNQAAAKLEEIKKSLFGTRDEQDEEYDRAKAGERAAAERYYAYLHDNPDAQWLNGETLEIERSPSAQDLYDQWEQAYAVFEKEKDDEQLKSQREKSYIQYVKDVFTPVNSDLNYTANEEADLKKAMDENGFIVNQDKLPDVYYGLRTSDANGCGWIAVYNALKMLGENPDVPTLIGDMEDGVIYKGNWGTKLGIIKSYFENLGYNVTVTGWKRNFNKNAQEADANIIFYWNEGFPMNGAHYVAFTGATETQSDSQKSGYYQFFNAGRGAPDNDITLQDLLAGKAFPTLISIKKKKK